MRHLHAKKHYLFEGIIDEFTCPCTNVCILTCEQKHECFLLTHKAELGTFRYHSVNQGPSFVMWDMGQDYSSVCPQNQPKNWHTKVAARMA